jgi:molecular chaperone GrpE
MPDETPNGAAAVPEVELGTPEPDDTEHVAAAASPPDPDPVAAVGDAGEAADTVTGDVDDAQVDLPTALAQRDEYLALARRVQADFENFRKRTIKQQQETAAAGAARLAEALLPVLDACDNAIIHGASDVAPIHKALFETLSKAGLEVVVTDGVAFDPNLHEAVLHEPGDGGEPQIVEVLRTGYLWHGKVLRAAMVKVKD